MSKIGVEGRRDTCEVGDPKEVLLEEGEFLRVPFDQMFQYSMVGPVVNSLL